jgi:hypothetical protein
MDPYLERREIWRSFHYTLAQEIMAELNLIIGERYYADVETRTVLEEGGILIGEIYPDAAVMERRPSARALTPTVAIPDAPVQRPAIMPERVKLWSVRIYEIGEERLVTAIEILSPVNKRGKGLETYSLKRRRLLLSSVHLVELDLLRGGQRPAIEVNNPPIDADYIALVNRYRADVQRISAIWPVAINQMLPVIPIPLLPPDQDAPLDLGKIFRSVYARAAYARRIDYSQPVPPPKLRPAMEEWWAERQRKTVDN